MSGRAMGLAVLALAAAVPGTAAAAPALDLDVSATTVALTQHVSDGAATAVVTLTNGGTTAVTVSAITRVGDPAWTVSAAAPCATLPCTLAGGAALTLTVAFDPGTIGAHDAMLAVTSSVAGSPTSVTLSGLGLGATLELADDLGEPPALDLGTVPVGATRERVIRLRNTGNVALADVALALAPPGGALALATPGPLALDAAGTAEVTVACAPLVAGPIAATLTATAPDAIAGSPLEVALACTGTTGSLYAVPPAVELGEIRVDDGPRSTAIELHTTGAPLTLAGPPALTAPPPGLSVSAPATLAIALDAPARFTLDVDPTIEADLATTIAVAAGDGVVTEQLAIPVTGRVVRALVDAPEELDAGSFCIGQATTSLVATLTATGSGRVGLPAQPVLAAMATSPFQLTYTAPVTYPYVLGAGDVAMVAVTPLRRATPGEEADDLLWTTDVPGRTEVTTRVTARFLADGGAISPQLIDFGGVPVGASAPARLIRVQNCGAAALTLAGPFIEPAGEFRDASTTPLPATLEPLRAATLEIAFAPARRGARSATLTVESSAGPLTVTLRGDGVVDDGGAAAESTSFYACGACAAGDADVTGALPLGLVALALRRRRPRPARRSAVTRRPTGSS